MIRIEGIKRVFNAHSRNANEVLKGVSFELPEKGLVAIFGKSGSGKTTLLNIIGGLDKQDAGHVFVDGEDTAGRVDFVRNAKIGYIFQNYYLENGYTIAEIMRHAMLIAGFKNEEEISRRTEEVLKLVKMDRYKNKKADALSGGQKQRVAIARALIKGSDVILADEPTGNLDAENTIIIMDILKEISRTQLVVLVTHEVTLIHNYADRHIKIVDGELKDNEELEADIKYEVDRNNIYVNSESKHTYDIGGTNINVYGDSVKADDIEIFTDDGSVYIRPGKGVTILDDRSEKKIVFSGEENKKVVDDIKVESIPQFEKSGAKKNGRLFNFKSIFKARREGEESIYSTANIFKSIFIAVMAIVMCFFSMAIFETSRTNIVNKMIDSNNVYVDLNAYDDIKTLDESQYTSIDFFDTQLKEGNFAFADTAVLSGIKADYVPRPIGKDATAESIKISEGGRMPDLGEVLITRSLAETLKDKFRLKELETDKAMLLVVFDGNYNVTGIVEGDQPAIFMNKQDYVNFLGVYNEVVFNDLEHLFFTSDYDDVAFTSEIIVGDESRGLTARETIIEINRNSLYKMMPDVIEADYKVKATNAILRSTIGATGLEIKDSNLYVRKLEITRDVMATDIRIYVSPETMDNIFVYLEPNVDALHGSVSSIGIESKFYFEIATNGGEQMANIKSTLDDRHIPLANIDAQYERENKEIKDKALSSLVIFIIVMVLLYCIYYFIEKSGSLKNSKEYGIYRAIGVNKGNLLYKETMTTLVDNLITYLVCYLITAVLIIVRYYMMNIAFSVFVGVAVGLFMLSSALMLLISLVPYLFVLVKTPAAILASYDI